MPPMAFRLIPYCVINLASDLILCLYLIRKKYRGIKFLCYYLCQYCVPLLLLLNLPSRISSLSGDRKFKQAIKIPLSFSFVWISSHILSLWEHYFRIELFKTIWNRFELINLNSRISFNEPSFPIHHDLVLFGA